MGDGQGHKMRVETRYRTSTISATQGAIVEYDPATLPSDAYVGSMVSWDDPHDSNLLQITGLLTNATGYVTDNGATVIITEINDSEAFFNAGASEKDYPVTYMDQATLERTLRPLEGIEDNTPVSIAFDSCQRSVDQNMVLVLDI